MDSTNIHTFKIKYQGKIPSVNQLYLTGRHGSRVWTYINPVVADFKKFIEKELIKQGIADQFEQYNGKEIGVEINFSFVIHENYWRRDVSNLIKATEDAIVNAGKIDDRYNLIVDSRKILNDLDDSEYIILVLRIYELSDFRYKWSQYATEHN